MVLIYNQFDGYNVIKLNICLLIIYEWYFKFDK